MVKRSGHVLDIAGKVFGRLTVLSYKGSDKHSQSLWEVRCECGVVKEVKGTNLRLGKTQSCGCYSRQRTREALSKPESYFLRQYRTYRSGAARRGHVFELSESRFRELITADCYYCGAAPSTLRFHVRPSLPGVFPCNGVDRRDNAKGYTEENSVTACTVCNTAKMAFSEAEFLIAVERIYNKRIRF